MGGASSEAGWSDHELKQLERGADLGGPDRERNRSKRGKRSEKKEEEKNCSG